MVSKGSPPVVRRERRALPRNQRGAPGNPPGRFEVLHIEPEPDETCAPDDTASARGVPTLYFREASRSIISSNTSPDVPFDRSVNPYRGCEHGCSYCYARPTHEYLGLSAGLDFETRIFVKPRAPDLLRAELSRRSWTPQVLAMSGVTDPYQPIERRLQLTRGCLAVLAEFRNPVGVITKSALVTRDRGRPRRREHRPCRARAHRPRDRTDPQAGRTSRRPVRALHRAAATLWREGSLRGLARSTLPPTGSRRCCIGSGNCAAGISPPRRLESGCTAPGSGRRPSRPCFTWPAIRLASHPQVHNSQPQRSGRPRDSPGCSNAEAGQTGPAS